VLEKFSQLFRQAPKSRFVIAVRRYLAIDLNYSFNSGEADVPKMAIEVTTDTVYFGLMAALIADIKSQMTVDSEAIIVRSVNAGLGFSVWSEIRRVAILNFIVTRQWIKSFGVLVKRVAYRSSSWSSPFKDAMALATSYRIWQIWKRQETSIPFDALVVDGIICGDLIIDSYIRFRPSASFHVRDIFVWRLLWQACRDITRARFYFRNKTPSFYLTTYSTYIEHGIPVRVALQEGVPVFSFGNFFKFGLQLTINHFRHTKDCSEYKKHFELLDAKARDTYLKEAERGLEFRMSGGVDYATRYMRHSAYAKTGNLNPSNNLLDLQGAVVIFLHDFYDSPHIWDNFIFIDFWEWIVTTIEILEKEKIKFFIKPHPNQTSLCDEAIVKLCRMHPRLNWLDSSIDNKTLAHAGISYGVTVYGSIAHELAYLGIPTIGAASAPHEAFKFCRIAKNLNEYIQFLANCHLPYLSSEDMKQEALEFFTIHNSLHDAKEKDVSTAFVEYWMLANGAQSYDDSQRAIKALDHLRSCAGYQALISKLCTYLGG
jgi:hypothetical protein